MSDPIGAARDPHTSPDQLTRLARHRVRDVRRCVAANPNTPTDVLGSLGRVFPEELVTNPVLDWLLLEDANWLGEFDAVARARLGAVASAPQSLLWWLARHGTTDDQLALASNPVLPTEIVRFLAAQNAAVGAAAIAHVHGPGPVTGDADPALSLVAMLDTSEAVTGTDLVTLLRLDAIPTWLFASMSRGDVEIRRALARLASTPSVVIALLAVDDDDDTRRDARAHPHWPSALETALVLLETRDPSLDPGALAEMPHTLHAKMLWAVHPRTGPDVLDALITDANWRVREAAASNPNLTATAFVRLSGDGDKDVRVAMAKNPSTPAFVVDLLEVDRHEEVRAALAARSDADRPVHPDSHGSPNRSPNRTRRGSPNGSLIALPKQLLPDDGFDLLCSLAPANQAATILLARHRRLEPERLLEFSRHSDWRIREAAALNPALPVSVAEQLLSDTDPDVRRAAMKHRGFDAALIESRWDDPHEEVRCGVVSITINTELLAKLAADRSTRVRVAVAQHHLTPLPVLLGLCGDGDASVRQALAARIGRPGTNDDASLLELADQLAADADDDVRSAVLAYPDVTDAALSRLFGPEHGSTHARVFRRLAAGDDRVRPIDVVRLFQAAPWARDRLIGLVISPTALNSLARLDDWRTRVLVAARADLPPASIRRLISDPDYDVRTAIAAHPQLDDEQLNVLGRDGHQLVRMAVVGRRDCPANLLAELVFDDDDTVRAAVLAHRNLPGGASERAMRLSEGGEVPIDVLMDLTRGSHHARRLAASHPHTPAAVLRRLVSDESWRVREDVARHPAATVAMLKRLAGDGDRDVRRSVASHARTPAEVIADLAVDGDDSVRSAAMRHPRYDLRTATPFEHRLVRRLARSKSILERAVALASPFVSPLELSRRRTWQSLHPLIRYAVASNPITPIDTLIHLANDGHRAVRGRAAQTLWGGSGTHDSASRRTST